MDTLQAAFSSVTSAHVANSSPDLGIRLQDGKTSFQPGDTVTGYIYRTTPTISSHAQCTVSLHGRAGSRVRTGSAYSSTDTYGIFKFFDPRRTTQVLYANVPLTIGPSGEGDGGAAGAKWYFSITIPTSADSGSVAASGFSQDQSYLSLNPHDIATQPLPPTFQLSSTGVEAAVEYYLKARLELSGKSNGFFAGLTGFKAHKAVLPLQVDSGSPRSSTRDFQLKGQTITRHVVSQRLVPGMENAKLSFLQKTQKAVASSKVPHLALQIRVEVPQVLQLMNENTVPFLVGIEPIWDETSEVLRGMDQNITLDCFKVHVKPTTSVRVQHSVFRSLLSESYASRDVMKLVTVDKLRPLDKKIQIPCGSTETSKGPGLVDVGWLVNFNLGERITRKLARERWETKIFPSFTTYNIQHTHELSWELSGMIAGEKIQLSGSNPVTLLPGVCEEDMRGAFQGKDG
ncbi:hypothetical protein FQN54_005957 [Arachnomyces sp. PD_36]|nr:hypothetical protein FQN54_005957 [Arachnomyces sp. PD_36]